MMLHTLGILVAIYGGLAVVLYFYQPRLIFFPEIDREVSTNPGQFGLFFEDIHLKAADDVELHGWYVPSPQSLGTVLFLHGNAGNISHRIDSIEMFHKLGYSIFIFDYRGYGKSTGKPTEQGLYRDAEAAWNYVTVQRRVPECNIVLFGESLGGAVAAWLAARHQPAALVISSGFTSVPDMAQQLYPYLPARWLARYRFDTRESLKSVSAPVLIAHSKEDDIIPFDHGRALFVAAHRPKLFLELSGGHNDGFIFMQEAWVRVLAGFLGKMPVCGQQPESSSHADRHEDVELGRRAQLNRATVVA